MHLKDNEEIFDLNDQVIEHAAILINEINTLFQTNQGGYDGEYITNREEL